MEKIDHRFRLLHIRNCAFMGSPEKLILAQMEGMTDLFDSELVILPDGPDKAFATMVKSRGITISTFPGFFSAFWNLRRVIKRGRMDIIVTHDYKSNFIGKIASLFLGIPQVAVFHGRTSHNLRVRFYEWVDDIILYFVKEVVAVSEASKLKLSFIKEKVSVIHNALDLNSMKDSQLDIRHRWGFDYSHVVFMTAGRLSPEKGHLRLIRSFKSVLRECPSARLIIAGEGEMKPEIESAIAEYGLESYIRLLGFVKDLDPVYFSSDVFVLPSDREGLPLVILEAAYYKKMTIATNVGGIPEVIEDGESGIVIPAKREKELTDAIVEMAKDPKARYQMGQRARVILEEQFSLNRYSSSFKKLYLALIQKKVFWITWEKHRRTRELANEFDAKLIEIVSTRHRLLRYPGLLFRTLRTIVSHRPQVLIVQSPSLILSALACWLKPMFRYKLIVDCHNESVEPFIHSSRLIHRLVKMIHQKADVCLVTNETLKRIVVKNGGRGLVLPDKVPHLPPSAEKIDNRGKSEVVFICTYAPDEPYQEVIYAGGELREDINLVITGNHKKADPQIIKEASSNVRFTGFIPELDYLRTLRKADVIIDLTEMDNCLVCGAYEAVALEKPLITSDTKALRRYFKRGTVYTQHHPQKLREAIQQAVRQKDFLSSEMKQLKKELGRKWNDRRQRVIDVIYEGDEK